MTKKTEREKKTVVLCCSHCPHSCVVTIDVDPAPALQGWSCDGCRHPYDAATVVLPQSGDATAVELARRSARKAEIKAEKLQHENDKLRAKVEAYEFSMKHLGDGGRDDNMMRRMMGPFGYFR